MVVAAVEVDKSGLSNEHGSCSGDGRVKVSWVMNSRLTSIELESSWP